MKLLKFEQPNCAPCKLVNAFLNENNVKYETVNVYDDPEMAGEYGIMGVPVVVLLDDDSNEIRRSVGFKPDELKDIISLL